MTLTANCASVKKNVVLLHDSTRYPLLGCMKRPSSLSMPDHLETVECVDEMGSKFWPKVDRLHGAIPVVCVVDSTADA